MYKKFITSLMLVVAMVAGSAFAVEPVSTKVEVPKLTDRAVFLASTAPILPDAQTKIIQTLEKLETTAKVQMAVLLVDTVQPVGIEEYSIKVAEQWKIGKAKEDNGLILVIAAKDRKTRIEVGYGMEGVITDAVSSRIINDYMIPHFKEGRWEDGIMEAIGRINNLANNKNVDEAIDPALGIVTAAIAAPVAAKASSNSSMFKGLKNMDGDAAIIALIFILIIALFTTNIGKLILIGIVIGGLISMSRKLIGSVASGAIGGIASAVVGFFFYNEWWIVAGIFGAISGAFGLMWLWHVLEILLHILANAKGGSSSSSRGGGFSGGGGRFGGGGSSGSW